VNRLARPRVAGAFFLLVVAVCVVLTSVSNAAGLSLMGSSGAPFAVSAARCTNATLTVSPSGPLTGGKFSQVTITGNLGSCSSGNVSVVGASSPHTVLFSAPVSISGGVGVANGDAFTAPESAGGQIVLGLDGWQVPAVWSYSAPVAQGPVTPGTNTEIVGGSPDWDIIGRGNQFCFTAVVKGTSATAQPWTLDLHVNERPFNGRTQASSLHLNTWDGFTWVSTTAQNGLLQVKGTGAKATITSSQQYTIEICDWGAPLPSYDPSLTYTVTTGPITGSPSNACIAVQVTVSGTPDFYAGWRADLDLTALLAYVSTPGATVRASDGRTVTFLSGKTYRISGTSWNHGTIRDDDPQNFEVCAS